MSDNHQRVVVLGASKNPERYSNMAVNRLLENGHEVIPVHPALERVDLEDDWSLVILGRQGARPAAPSIP